MLVKRRIIQIILGAVLIVLMNGCEDKIKETNNDITIPRATYNQLLDSLETSKLGLKEARGENIELRNNNKTLDVNLAKSELTFTKKTEKEIQMKTYGIAAGIIIVLLIIGSLFFRREMTRKNTQLEENEEKIKKSEIKNEEKINELELRKEEMEKNQKEFEKSRAKLSKDLEILKLEQKQSSLNSVVNKIEERESRRVQMLNRIKEV